MQLHIIVPSFNQGKYIGATLESLVKSQEGNTRVYVVDGGSTDETLDVIDKFKPDLDYFLSEKDEGQTDALNKGFAAIKGADYDFINWINSDDLLKPNILNNLNTIANSNKDVRIICGGCEDVDDKGNFLKLRQPFPSTKMKGLYSALRHVGYCQPSTFYRLDIYTRLMPLPVNLHFCMDYVLWLRYLFLFGFSGIIASPNVTFASFRRHGEAKSGDLRRGGFIKEVLLIYRDFDKFVESYKPHMGNVAWHLRIIIFKTIFAVNALALLKKKNVARKDLTGVVPGFIGVLASLIFRIKIPL